MRYKPDIKKTSEISGLILFNKKPGVTSFRVLSEIKRGIGTSKVGHTGTLDKFAQGLLLVLTGSSLRLAKWFSGLDKQYTGRIHFGIETDTLDPEGQVIAESPVPARERVERVLSSFTGEILQEPPVYSAIHVNGRRASDLARSGELKEMEKRPVSVYKLELLNWEPPFADIFVHCSSGTYIRSLARDIALAAGGRAHLCSLIRTRVGGFRLDDAFSGVENWKTGDNKDEKNLPFPIDKSIVKLLGLPRFELSFGEAEHIFHGRSLSGLLDKKPLYGQLSGTEAGNNTEAAVFYGEDLIAIVNKSNNDWKYSCVINKRLGI